MSAAGSKRANRHAPFFLPQAATSPLTKAKKTILNLLADEQQKQRNAGDLLAHKDVSKHDP